MTANRIKFTIAFNDPDLDAEEKDEQVQRLISELKQIDEIDTVVFSIPNHQKATKH